MEQTQTDTPARPPVERAEEFWNNLGRGLGRLAGGAGQSLGHAAAAAREAMDNMDRPAAANGNGHPATERAEHIVDDWGARLSLWADAAGHEIRRAVAFGREEIEDIVAEAQEIRRANPQKPG